MEVQLLLSRTLLSRTFLLQLLLLQTLGPKGCRLWDIVELTQVNSR